MQLVSTPKHETPDASAKPEPHSSRRRQLLALFGALPGSLAFELTHSAEIKTATSEAWMEEWMKGRKAAVGGLHLFRFADPWYVVTKEIQWNPDPRNPRDNGLPSVAVPVGFVSDLASIPRLFWSVLRPDGHYAFAAIVHDYLYWDQVTTREIADRIFERCMIDLKVNSEMATSIYAAVRAGGSAPWANNAKLKSAGEGRILKHWPDDPVTTWGQWKKDPTVFVRPA